MLVPVKEKSWKVLLMKGYVLNDHVKSEQCENCKSISQVLTTNFSDPNLLLYGCKDSKCRHRMLRLDFDSDTPKTFSPSFIEKKESSLMY